MMKYPLWTFTHISSAGRAESVSTCRSPASCVGLHQVFTANMTGNVIVIGLGLAGHAGTQFGRPLIALGGFALGAVLCSR
jgi:hypothetical protein